jgi:hypothetical protein
VCGIVRVISDEDVKNIKCDINSSILKTMQLPKEKKKKNGRQNITQKILNNAKILLKTKVKLIARVGILVPVPVVKHFVLLLSNTNQTN